jgi:hypothetical protein
MLRDLPTKHSCDLHEYLLRVSCPGDALIGTDVAAAAWSLWLAIEKEMAGKMPVPSASTGPNGVMFFSWDRDEHHLEVELLPGGIAELFYRNRNDESAQQFHEGAVASLQEVLPRFLGLFTKDDPR